MHKRNVLILAQQTAEAEGITIQTEVEGNLQL